MSMKFAKRLVHFDGGQLIRASAALILAQVVSAAVGILFWGLLSRNYPSDDVGQATTLIATASAITLLMTAGLAPALMLVIPRVTSPGDSATVGWLAAGVFGALGALGGAIVGVALPVLTPNFAFMGSGWTPLILAAITGASATGIVADAVATALKRTWLVAVRALAFSVSKVVLLAILLALGLPPLSAVGASWALCAVVTGVAVLGWGTAWTAPRRWRFAGQTLSRGISHHHTAGLGSGLPPFLLPIMVTGALGASVSAQFSIAWMIASAFFMVSPAVAAAALAHGAADSHDLRGQLRRASTLTALLITPPIAICLLAGATLLGVFGDGYRVAAPLLALLAVSAIPDAVTNLAVTLERIRGNLRRATTINVAVGGVAIAGVWILLPVAGLIAPGIGWLAGQMAGCALACAYFLLDKRSVAR
jgi:O-antigen/teichoic acid export membrane protein